jgi:class 3 adenylate cyclase
VATVGGVRPETRYARSGDLNIAYQVVREAKPGEIMVSSTVKDLVAGSGIQFEDRGVRPLKGVPGEWHLFAVKA